MISPERTSTMADPHPSFRHLENRSPVLLALITAGLSAILTLTLGPWTLAVLPFFFLVLKLTPNLHITFLLFLCHLPVLGEFDVALILPNIYLPFYALLVTSWFYHVFTCPKRIYFHGPLAIAYLTFLLVCTLSLLGSYDLSSEPGAEDLLRGPYRFVWEPLLVTSFGILAMSAFETERQLERIFWIIVLSGLFYALTIFFLGVQIELSIEGDYVGRRQGLFPDAGPAAIYMLFCTILAVSLLTGASGKIRTLLLFAIGLFLSTQILTISKTAMVAMVIVFLLAAFLEEGLKGLLLYGALLAIGGLALFPLLPVSLQTPILQIFVSLFVDPTRPVGNQGGSASTFAVRSEHWKIGFDLLTTDLSLLGFGFGKYFFAMKPQVLLHVHYIAILADTGIIGLLVFLTLILMTLFIAFRSLRYYRRMKHEKMFSLVKGLILSFFVVLIGWLALPGHQVCLRLFWLLVGLIAATDRLMKATQLQAESTSVSALSR